MGFAFNHSIVLGRFQWLHFGSFPKFRALLHLVTSAHSSVELGAQLRLLVAVALLIGVKTTLSASIGLDLSITGVNVEGGRCFQCCF
jgi:hypothetical protein